MTDEYTVCAAAFFRGKGCNITTRTQFVMSTSMDWHWMKHKHAGTLVDILLSKGLLIESGEFIKPAFNVSDVEVPVAYKPSDDLIESLENASPKRTADPAPKEIPKAPAPKKEQPTDTNPLQMMIQEAVESGMEKRDFISEANSVSKRLNIDMLVAGLLILRDRGVDIDPLADRIYDIIISK